MKKSVFYTELSYIVGLFLLALGTALMVLADFGVSMVVAPAYILHIKISQFLPFFSFGMAEYTLQAIILVLMMCILGKAKLSYLFSFVTAVLYGFMLDGATAVLSVLPCDALVQRIVLFAVGILLSTIGIAFLFHTYIPPEAYELFVKEVSAKFGLNLNKFKIAYDVTSCLISVVLSFAFFGFGHFVGVNVGTFITAAVNGLLIWFFTGRIEKIWEFKDRFSFAKYFK